jgi:hypothetical protein
MHLARSCSANGQRTVSFPSDSRPVLGSYRFPNPVKFTHDPRCVEADGSVSQRRDKMQQVIDKLKAAGQH